MWPNLIFYIFAIAVGILSEFTRYRRRYGGGANDEYTGAEIFDPAVNYFQKRNRRISALKKAAQYLKPYEKINGNLTLSNKYCTAALVAKKKTFVCSSKTFNAKGNKMILTAQDFSPMNIDEYWDMLCEIFSWNTDYDTIYKSLTALAIIKETVLQTEPVQAGTPAHTVPEEQDSEPVKVAPSVEREFLDINSNKLIDINTCSEAELTALPGINIVMSKKIIKFREEERGFNSVDDFISTMNIKSHFAGQLRGLLTAEKINVKKIKNAKNERILDL